VTLERFLRERQRAWTELEELVRAAGRRPWRLGPGRVRRLGELYRSAAADLAFARRRFRGDPVVRRLEELVGRSRSLVYDTRARRGSLVRFATRGYWRLVAERPLALAVAAALLFAPAALAGGWALRDPAGATGLVPREFRAVTEQEEPWQDLDASQQAQFSSYVFTNNIRVTALAFAGGIAFGLLTGLVLVFNGALLGAVAGLMVGAGNGRGFLELVTAHGVLELSCIVVGGAAGLRLGWALVEPGRLPRRVSAVREARRTVAIVIGTAPWLVLAGLVESARADWAQLGLPAVLGVGLGLGALYWGLVLWRGRPDAEDPLTGELSPSP
jgi:uncharacterized membrane protein SpoIIM required for sporulation